jgi:hypothetical protein
MKLPESLEHREPLPNRQKTKMMRLFQNCSVIPAVLKKSIRRRCAGACGKNDGFPQNIDYAFHCGFGR